MAWRVGALRGLSGICGGAWPQDSVTGLPSGESQPKPPPPGHGLGLQSVQEPQTPPPARPGRSSACLPSRCPEGSLGLVLLSLCLQTLRRALGLGDKRSLVRMSLALDTQLLLSLQVVHAYLKQTSNSDRPPALQHV